VSRPNQRVEIGERTEPPVDADVVADVVAEVAIGRRMDRREPDRVNAEVAKVWDRLDNAAGSPIPSPSRKERT
jgi:hypothetical protein